MWRRVALKRTDVSEERIGLKYVFEAFVEKKFNGQFSFEFEIWNTHFWIDSFSWNGKGNSQNYSQFQMITFTLILFQLKEFSATRPRKWQSYVKHLPESSHASKKNIYIYV
jgi:hypothetical protein